LYTLCQVLFITQEETSYEQEDSIIGSWHLIIAMGVLALIPNLSMGTEPLWHTIAKIVVGVVSVIIALTSSKAVGTTSVVVGVILALMGLMGLFLKVSSFSAPVWHSIAVVVVGVFVAIVGLEIDHQLRTGCTTSCVVQLFSFDNAAGRARFGRGCTASPFSHDGRMLAWNQNVENIPGNAGGAWVIKTSR